MQINRREKKKEKERRKIQPKGKAQTAAALTQLAPPFRILSCFPTQGRVWQNGNAALCHSSLVLANRRKATTLCVYQVTKFPNCSHGFVARKVMTICNWCLNCSIVNGDSGIITKQLIRASLSAMQSIIEISRGNDTSHGNQWCRSL